MRKILVTGGAGFVGRHLIQKLLKAGDEVHCVDNIAFLTGGIDPKHGWSLFNPLDFKNFHFYKKDCREFFKSSSDTDFDYAFHLAAMVGGRLIIENNPLAVADDLSIDAEYWQWAAKVKPKKNVVFSSSAAYPVNLQTRDNYTLLKEDMISFDNKIGIPDMTYGWAKLTNEYLALLAYKKHNLKSVVYRPFSGYGLDQDDNYPFPGICKRILKNKGKSVIEVWGSGKQMRDFIHIDDCIEGILKTMDRIDDASAINLSTGIYTSFIDFAKTAVDLCGFKAEVRGMSDMPEGVFARGGDTEKQKKLGFQYTTDFRTGIKKALDYYNKLVK
ncbi:MAG: NAD(P)-dependent oxidoreductase [Spirochaetes bacterium]|nr:NAD(P)-dependent oxidoreductase [Spirochaetota bacterium]